MRAVSPRARLEQACVLQLVGCDRTPQETDKVQDYITLIKLNKNSASGVKPLSSQVPNLASTLQDTGKRRCAAGQLPRADLVLRLPHQHSAFGARPRPSRPSLTTPSWHADDGEAGKPADGSSRPAAASHRLAGGMLLTVPCFSCEYFLRTAFRLLLDAALCSA